MGEMAAVFKMTFANIQSMKYIRLYIIQREIRPGTSHEDLFYPSQQISNLLAFKPWPGIFRIQFGLRTKCKISLLLQH